MRTRLVLIVATLLLPLLAVLVYVLLDLRARERAHAAEQVVRLAHIIAASERQIMRNVADYLATLAQSPVVRGSDARACEQALRSLQQSQPNYANLGVIDAEGRLWCSALPAPPTSLADRSYFRNALATQAFAVGEFQVGRITGRPAINFGFPVIASDGTVRGVVFAALDVRVLNQLARTAGLPQGTILTLIDEHATVLTREPGHDLWVGRTFPAGKVRTALQEQPDSGIVIGRGVDGVERLYAYTAVELAGAGKRLAVIAGTPVTAVFGHVRGVVIYTSLAFGSMVALGLVAAWFTADRLVLNRVQALSHAAERWTRGDLAARTGVASGSDELGQLARGLDVMADRLEQHAQELESKVQARTAELQAVNQELESFSYSVSHDLRSPLRSIAGFSQAVEEDYAAVLDDRGRDYLRRLRAGAQRMGQLIDDLLQLSRVTRHSLVREPVNLSDVARQTARELQESEPARRVEIEIAAGLEGTGDPSLLRIALNNLLSNAWKFTSRTQQARIEFGAINENGHRTFYVRDNGVGFDMQFSHKLFGAFQRLHAAQEFEGTGIGLATVQRVINRHGGRVWAEAELGQGAAFFFTLPS